MGDIGVIVVLYAVALFFLVAEIFTPSHGLLTVAGVGFLAYAVVRTFQMSTNAGVIATMACGVTLPTAAVLAVRLWPRTWIGKLIAPDNPRVTARDVGVELTKMQEMVGRTGRSLSPLRPSGICEIDGQRFPCVAEIGMIESGVDVRVIGIKGSNLAVVVQTGSAAV